VKRLDLTGQRFGRLVALERYSERTEYGKSQWECKCDCGCILLVVTGALTTGNTKSCGCQRTDSSRQNGLNRKTHGMTGTAEYKAWQSLRERCFDPEHEQYHNYGGRGITVCERWQESFENFYEDMGARPGIGYSIDRKDNDGNYEPSNCRWATFQEQINNRRVSVLYDFEGERLTVSDIARRTGIPVGTLESRVRRMNLSIEEAVKREKASRLYTYNGETKSLGSWSKEFGIPYGKLYQRVVNMKWPIERALSSKEK
jgi:hypothetical protein